MTKAGAGTRPIVDMFVRPKGCLEIPVRVLFDSGSDTAMISDKIAARLPNHVIDRRIPRVMGAFHGGATGVGRKQVLANVVLRHGDYRTTETFKVSPFDPDFDAFLPYGWTQIHVPLGFFGDPKDIRFESNGCRKCNRLRARIRKTPLPENILTAEPATITFIKQRTAPRRDLKHHGGTEA